MDGDRESPTSSPAPGNVDDYFEGEEEADLGMGGEAMPVAVVDRVSYRYQEEGDEVSESYQYLPQRSPEPGNSVSASYRFMEDVSPEGPSPSPSNSGLDLVDEMEHHPRFHLSPSCAPSSSGSILSSSLQRGQEPQNSGVSGESIFSVESGVSNSNYTTPASTLPSPSVSSWSSRLDLPISSSWSDTSADWLRSHYTARGPPAEQYSRDARGLYTSEARLGLAREGLLRQAEVGPSGRRLHLESDQPRGQIGKAGPSRAQFLGGVGPSEPASEVSVAQRQRMNSAVPLRGQLMSNPSVELYPRAMSPPREGFVSGSQASQGQYPTVAGASRRQLSDVLSAGKALEEPGPSGRQFSNTAGPSSHPLSEEPGPSGNLFNTGHSDYPFPNEAGPSGYHFPSKAAPVPRQAVKVKKGVEESSARGGPYCLETVVSRALTAPLSRSGGAEYTQRPVFEPSARVRSNHGPPAGGALRTRGGVGGWASRTPGLNTRGGGGWTSARQWESLSAPSASGSLVISVGLNSGNRPGESWQSTACSSSSTTLSYPQSSAAITGSSSVSLSYTQSGAVVHSGSSAVSAPYSLSSSSSTFPGNSSATLDYPQSTSANTSSPSSNSYTRPGGFTMAPSTNHLITTSSLGDFPGSANSSSSTAGRGYTLSSCSSRSSTLAPSSRPNPVSDHGARNRMFNLRETVSYVESFLSGPVSNPSGRLDPSQFSGHRPLRTTESLTQPSSSSSSGCMQLLQGNSVNSPCLYSDSIIPRISSLVDSSQASENCARFPGFSATSSDTNDASRNNRDPDSPLDIGSSDLRDEEEAEYEAGGVEEHQLGGGEDREVIQLDDVVDLDGRSGRREAPDLHAASSESVKNPSPSTSSNPGLQFYSGAAGSSRPAVAPRSTLAKRSIHFPDSPYAPDPKRLRMLEDEVRPDSPSAQGGMRQPESRRPQESRMEPSAVQPSTEHGGRVADTPDDDCDLDTGNAAQPSDADFGRYPWNPVNTSSNRNNSTSSTDRPGSSSGRIDLCEASSEARFLVSPSNGWGRGGGVGPSNDFGQGSSRSIYGGLNSGQEERAGSSLARLYPSPPARAGSSAGDRNTSGRVGSTDSVVPSPAYESRYSDGDWEGAGPSLVSGSELASRVNPVSRRTVSESSEAEGTVTYNRELYMMPLHLNIHQSGEASHHVSPSGSEVSEAGPSNLELRHRLPTPGSPSESDVSVAESSHNRVTDHSNPNSPTGSDLDEAGPGPRFLNYPAPRSWFSYDREAAPAPRILSPEPYRHRSRQRASDQCVISSSTGPADSSPPTPENILGAGNIDADRPSPPRHLYMEDDEAVVDSTVDSTSGIFMLPSPVFLGNEAEHDGDSEEDSDINDSESIPGSEASSTTASLNEQNFNMPGFDDNEGISTSGQVDNGNFRLVPNDGELNHLAGSSSRELNAVGVELVPDIQASLSSDESVGQNSDQEQQRNTFKKPFNRKGRLLENYENDQEPQPGPSNLDRGAGRQEAVPLYTQGSISLTLVSSDSVTVPPAPQSSRLPSVSLFPIKSSAYSAGSPKGSLRKSSGSSLTDVMTGRSYADSLGIGLAFSGLPSSLTVNTDSEAGNKPTEKQISGPLSKRLRTRHMQEVALASKEERQADSGEVRVVLQAEEVVRTTDTKAETRPQVSIIPIPMDEPLEAREPAGISTPIIVENSAPLASAAVVLEAVPNDVMLLNDVNPEEGGSGLGEAGSAVQERPGGSETNFFLGGTQQTFTVRIEPTNISISAIRNKNLLSEKVSEYGELFEFESGMKHDANDLPLIITDAINDVDISAEESIEIFTDADKVISESVSNLIKHHAKIATAYRPESSLESGEATEDKGEGLKRKKVTDKIFEKEDKVVDRPGSSIQPSTLRQEGQLEKEVEKNSDVEKKMAERKEGLVKSNRPVGPVTAKKSGPDSELKILDPSQPTNQLEGILNTEETLDEPVAKEGKKEGDREEEEDEETREGEESREEEEEQEEQYISENIRPVVGISYSCSICDRKFERQISLSRHLVLHKGDKKYVCAECGQKFSHSENLERHKRRLHNVDPSGSRVRCVPCGLWFPSTMVLKVHMFEHNPDKEQQNWTVEDAIAQTREASGSGREEEEPPAQKMKFQCPCEGCDQQYDTWLELVNHTGQHGHPALPARHGEAAAAAELHKCELCYKMFGTEQRLKNHMAVHGKEENKPLQCRTCGKRFLTNSALAGHMKVHAAPNQLYDCPICSQEFEQMTSLKDHIPSHKVDDKFTCVHCGKQFTEYSNIRKHIRAHHAERRHTCEMCRKSFMTNAKLKQHMLTHSLLKEFSCPHCSKEFKRKDKLRIHIKSHENPVHAPPPPEPSTPPPAEPCAPAPASLQPVRAGTYKVEPTDLEQFTFKCDICKLGFKRRGMLVNHLAKRHPEIPPSSVPELNLPIMRTTKYFYCQYCSKVYKSSSKRKVHILKIHPGQALPLNARQIQRADATAEDQTCSLTVGSVTSQPHSCQQCHRQYASKAKLYQHQRDKHSLQYEEDDAASTSTVHNRPSQVLYIDETSSNSSGSNPLLGTHPGYPLFGSNRGEEDPAPIAGPSRAGSNTGSSLGISFRLGSDTDSNLQPGSGPSSNLGQSPSNRLGSYQGPSFVAYPGSGEGSSLGESSVPGDYDDVEVEGEEGGDLHTAYTPEEGGDLHPAYTPDEGVLVYAQEEEEGEGVLLYSPPPPECRQHLLYSEPLSSGQEPASVPLPCRPSHEPGGRSPEHASRYAAEESPMRSFTRPAVLASRPPPPPVARVQEQPAVRVHDPSESRQLGERTVGLLTDPSWNLKDHFRVDQGREPGLPGEESHAEEQYIIVQDEDGQLFLHEGRVLQLQEAQGVPDQLLDLRPHVEDVQLQCQGARPPVQSVPPQRSNSGAELLRGPALQLTQLSLTSRNGRILRTVERSKADQPSAVHTITSSVLAQPERMIRTSEQGRVYTTGEQGRVYTTADQGRLVTTADQGRLYTTAEQGRVYATMEQGRVYSTAEQGQMYTMTEPGRVYTTADQGRVYTTADLGRVYTTADQGRVYTIAEQGHQS